MRGNQSEQLSEDEHLFKEQLSEAVGRLYPVIASQLGNFATEDDIADVAQATWESAWRSRNNYDPNKGPLHPWVVTIARYRAIDLFNAKVTDIEHQQWDQHLARAGDRSDPVFAVEATDHADGVIDSLDASHQITQILRVVEDVIQNRASTARGLSLIMIFDDDLELASRTLGLGEDVLRRARRELIMCCQVVANAKHTAEIDDGRVTLRMLLECLPSMTEAGDWTRQLTLAVATAGGFDQVTIDHVMDVTGYSYNTARQYLVQSQHLIQVAATAIHRFRSQERSLSG